MPFALVYIIKFSISLAVVFLFYQLVLRKLTFYNWNRFYLLGYTLFSFFVPCIDISGVFNQNKIVDNGMLEWMPVFQLTTANDINESGNGLTVWNTISLLILMGVMIMTIRLIIQLISFNKMMKNATIISQKGLSLYQINEKIIPFSFGNSVFINKNLHNEEELEEIIRHEMVHVKQHHSVDIIWSEILCLINWFNPFAWLIRKAIRQNLEFIADNKVLDNGVDRKQYQYLLLKVIGNNHFSIAPKFNFSSLKKRIAMMNKLKSTKVNLLRFLFVLPLLAVILVSFRKEIGDTLKGNSSSQTNISSVAIDTVPLVKTLSDKGYYIDIWKNKEKGSPMIIIRDKNKKEVKRLTIEEWNSRTDYYVSQYGELPPPPPPPAPPKPPAPPRAIALPDNVQRINVKKDIATVWLKNGQKEKYDMTVISERKDFENKYGEMPPPPPPVPPVPPVPAIAPVATETNGLSKVAKEYEITDKKAVLHLKNGSTEVYDLTDKTERKNFENKYGEIQSRGLNAVAPVVSAGSVNGTGRSVIASRPVAYVSGTGHTVIAPMVATAAGSPLMVDNYGYTITGEEDVLITITNKTTRNQLTQFVKQMKEKNIELVFEEIEYDNDNLIKLTGSMKSKDGRSNFVATDFSKLILAMIRNGEKTYFKVSVKDKVNAI